MHYYDINYFDFEKGLIEFKVSDIVNSKITGLVGPAYDNVANCYIFNFICAKNNNYTLKCKIDKKDSKKVLFSGKYSIYSLEGYSLNPIQLSNKINRNVNLKIFILNW